MDDATAHATMWHEDDELHQAEGMVSARLGIHIDDAVSALAAYATSEGTSVHSLAARVVRGTVTIAATTGEPPRAPPTGPGGA